MKTPVVVLLTALSLAGAGAEAYATPTYQVNVKPTFTTTLTQFSDGSGTTVFAINTNAPAPDQFGRTQYGLGFLSVNADPSHTGQFFFQVENDTMIFGTDSNGNPNTDGPVTEPYDIVSDVTLHNLALVEDFGDGSTATLPLFSDPTDPTTQTNALDTSTLFLDTMSYALPSNLTSATLIGSVDLTRLTIAAPEPQPVVALAVGSALLFGLVARRRRAA